MVFSVFATACLIRPISAFFIGKIGDTKGRRITLLISINLMWIATFMVGILPSYHEIGVLAPILLILLRLIQGFSVSGEETGAAVYLSEESKKNNIGFLTSFVLASVYLGLLIGSIICGLISHFLSLEQMTLFGWRIPFLLALPLGLGATYLRSKSKESSEFICIADKIEKKPINVLFVEYRLELFKATLKSSILAIGIYLFVVYLPNYLQMSIGYTTSLYLTSCGLLIVSLLCPIVGYLGDRYGIVTIFRIGCIFFALAIFPICLMLNQTSITSIIFAYVLMAMALLPVAGSLFSLLVKMFPVSVRYSGVTISFNIGMTLFGSSAPIIAHFLQNSSVGMLGIAFYASFISIISFITTFRLNTNSRKQTSCPLNPLSD